VIVTRRGSNTAMALGQEKDTYSLERETITGLEVHGLRLISCVVN